MTLSLLLTHLASLSPSDIAVPTPTTPPGPFGDVVNTVMNWVLWAVFAICGLTVVTSGGYFATGGLLSRPHHREAAFRALFGGIGGAVLAIGAIALLNGVIDIS